MKDEMTPEDNTYLDIFTVQNCSHNIYMTQIFKHFTQILLSETTKSI